MQCPGGHLEYGESFAECAKREVLEETGLEVGNVEFLVATNDVFGEGKHYVTVFVKCTIVGENKVPQACVLLGFAFVFDADCWYSLWSRRSVRGGTGFLGSRCGLGRNSRLQLRGEGRRRRGRCFCRL